MSPPKVPNEWDRRYAEQQRKRELKTVAKKPRIKKPKAPKKNKRLRNTGTPQPEGMAVLSLRLMGTDI